VIGIRFRKNKSEINIIFEGIDARTDLFLKNLTQLRQVSC